jgi:hypothetical protein
VRGTETFRQRLLIRPGRGDFGRIPTVAEVEASLEYAGLTVGGVARSGPMLFFEAAAGGDR